MKITHNLPIFIRLALCGLGAALLFVGNASAQNQSTQSETSSSSLLVNGDFESPPFDTLGTVTGWTVGGAGKLEVKAAGATSGTHSAAFSTGGDFEGSILSQSFATVPGQIYTLEFDAAIFGIKTGTLQLQVRADDENGVAVLWQGVTPPYVGTDIPSQVQFQHYSFSFISRGLTTTVRFIDVGLGNATADIVLDTVSVRLTPSASLVANGNFETGPFNTRTITGWTVGGTGKMEATSEGSTSPSHSAAFGTGGNFQGSTLSQYFFSATPGQAFALDFDAAVFGVPTAPLQLKVQAFVFPFENIPQPVLDEIVTPPASNTYTPSQVQFQHYHFTFKTPIIFTELRFTDLGLGNAGADLVLDTVTVTPAPPSLLVNGDFETGPFDTRGVVTGWNINGPDLEVKREGATSGTHSAVFSAGADSQGNGINQFFPTVPGQTYTLEFDAGVFGITASQLKLSVAVWTHDSVLSDEVTPPYSGTYDPARVKFQHYRYTFTATSDSGGLFFENSGLGNASADVVLDSVTVTGPTPTPSPTPSPTPTPTPSPTPALLVNGNFEATPVGTRGVITGWTVGGPGRIAESLESATSPTHSAAFSEGGDTQGNTLSQSFATIAGQMYALEFDAGIFGIKSGDLQLRVRLTGNSSLLNQLVTPPYAGTYSAPLVRFQNYYYLFTANSGTTTLQFSDLGLGNAGADVVLDTVSVVGPNPPVQLLPNGNFEAGSADWSAGGAAGVVAGAYPRTGNFYAYLGNAANTTGRLDSAGILIPDAATTIAFSFWLNITSQKPPGTSLDKLNVVAVVVGTGGARSSHLLATFSETDQGSNQPGNPNYSKYTFDLSSIWGPQTMLRSLEIVFFFDSTTNTSLPAVFRIDDARVEATIP